MSDEFASANLPTARWRERGQRGRVERPTFNVQRRIGRNEDKRNTGVPSKANIGKLDNPARLKINHQAVTEPSV
jgi:hypothetical protein